jgi:uncharacterized membrane protein YagU involved in acid resistance
VAAGAGTGLIRGAMYGFLCWVAVTVSIIPAIGESDLPWELDEVRQTFPSFPAYILFGGLMAVLYHWTTGFIRLLFTDTLPETDEEGVGTQALRALGRGALSGIVGGLIFTGVMAQAGAFPKLAGLVGASSPVTGFAVHLAIAIVVGASYAVLFHRQRYDMVSAVGWSVSYGFVWWLIGPLTLMPILLGTTPDWTAGATAQVFHNRIGHLAYGAGLGTTLQLLESRYKPWWVPQRQVDAIRVERRKEQVLTSAPVLLGVDTGSAIPEPVY